MDKRRRLLFLWLCAATGTLCAQEPTPEQRAAQLAQLQEGIARLRALDLPATLAASGGYKVFVQLLQDGLLAQNLSAPGPFVFFVPTDAAWMQHEGFKQLQNASQAEKAQAVLRHVCPDSATAGENNRKVYQSLAGTSLVVNENLQHVNGIGFVAQNIRVSNGFLHILNGVLS